MGVVRGDAVEVGLVAGPDRGGSGSCAGVDAGWRWRGADGVGTGYHNR